LGVPHHYTLYSTHTVTQVLSHLIMALGQIISQ